MASPASALLFVRRNPGRVVPAGVALLLSAFLLAGLLPLVRSLKANIYLNVGLPETGILVSETNRLAFDLYEERDFLELPGVAGCYRLA